MDGSKVNPAQCNSKILYYEIEDWNVHVSQIVKSFVPNMNTICLSTLQIVDIISDIVPVWE